MATVTTSQNINAVTYAAGENITVGNTQSSLVRLTIDAQNSSDVSKIEGTLIGSLLMTGNSEIYVVNNSTTTPLIVKLNTQTSKEINTSGPTTTFKTRGAMIEIGTGTGAYDQTISTVIGGKSIDWPPFVEVETASGSGVYVQMLNIQGNYNNDASVVPANKRTFSELAATKELGYFYEYDELNRVIHFASAAGGWVPPSGAKIRIPNIHFTAVGVPAASVGNRATWLGGNGNIDLECTTFSNRFNGQFAQYASVRAVQSSFTTNHTFAVIRKTLYIRNCAFNFDVYAASGHVLRGAEYGHDVDGLKAATTASSNFAHQLGPNAVVKNVSTTIFARSMTYAGGCDISQVFGTDATLKRVEDITVVGGLYIGNLNNVVIKNINLADQPNSTTNTSSRTFGIRTNNQVRNTTLQTIRRANGGGPAGYAMFGAYEGYPIRNVAVHDIDYDLGSVGNYGIYGGYAERLWVANGTINNPASGLASSFSNALSRLPSRLQNIKGTIAQAYSVPGGAYASMCTAHNSTMSITNEGQTPDAPNLHVTYNSGTTGVMSLALTTAAGGNPNYVVNAGVLGTDFIMSRSYLFVMTTTADLTYTSKVPARGITSFTGASLVAPPSGWVVQFKMRSANRDQDWPASWTSSTSANWTAAFNALVDYDSDDGFEIQVNIASSTNGNDNFTDKLAITGLTVDTTFAPFDVGFVDFAVAGGQNGARVAIIDTTSGDVIRALETLDATGAKSIDYPYNYDDGIERSFRLVVRKVGYAEYVATGSIGQVGYSSPVPQVAGHAATNASVSGIALDGAAKTIVVTGSKTFQEVYQHSQWWSVQRTNFVYDIPMASADGSTFSVPLTWKITWAMPSDKTLAGGWLLLGTPGTLNYKLSGTKIEFQTAGNYDMGGTAFSGTVEFVNTSGGAVTVAVPAGTSYTNTGPSITVTAPTVTQGLAFTGLVAGSQVVVYATGSTTELFRDNASATTETWSQAGGTDATVDYTIQKAGYLPIRVVGVTVNSAVLPTPVQQSVDRSYVASSGLAFGTTATVDTGTSRFAVTTATTVQNWYSFMIESWIAQSALKNTAFPISTNGPNSFTLEGWEFSSGLSLLYRDGLRYTASGVTTAIYAALYSVDTASGLQIKYQQTDGGTTVAAANTGKIDQLVQVYGDASHGNFDKRTFLALKVQADGYDQAQTDVVATYGTLEDQLYVIGLNPASNGLTTGAPTVNGSPTITDHGASPVTWNSKAFSITITDSAAGNDGETLMRWIRYNLGAGGAFQGKDGFCWHDLVQVNGDGFKTVRGNVYGDTGATLKGVRVITNAGADHPDFNLHTADDGTTYVPVFPAAAAATVLADTRVQLYNVTTAAEIDSQFVTGTAYSYTVTAGVSPGDTLRLRACKKGYEAAEATALWVAGGVTFLLSQNADAVYSSWGIDGATVTEYALDGTNIQIDANDVDGATEKTRLGAFYSYALTTEAGIRTFYGAMTFLSSAAIRINVGVVNLKIDNINATTALYFTDLSVRLYRSDGSSIIAPSSYSIHNDYSGVPDVVETGVSGLTGAESSQLLGLPSAAATASAVLAAASTTPIAADIKKVNAQTISGAGVEADPWGP